MFSLFDLLPTLNIGMLPTIVVILIHVGISYGIFTLAKKCGLPHPAYAWIPCWRYRLLGQLADDYRVKQGKSPKLARILPVASIICEAIALLIPMVLDLLTNVYLTVFVVCMVVILVGIASGILIALAILGYLFIFLAAFVFSAISSALSGLVSVAAMAFYALYVWGLYYVYKRCKPEYATLCTIFSAIFNFVPPILLSVFAHKYGSKETKADSTPVDAGVDFDGEMSLA